MENIPTWAGHYDVIQYLIAGAMLVICWFFVRTLKGIDRNQEEMFRRLTTVETDLSKLCGEHEAMMTVCPARKR